MSAQPWSQALCDDTVLDLDETPAAPVDDSGAGTDISIGAIVVDDDDQETKCKHAAVSLGY